MDGPSDAQNPEGTAEPGLRPHPARGRSVVKWIVVPAILGTLTGIFVVVVPWSGAILTLVFVLAGFAWLLRIAGDWIVEHAGPQRGVIVIGSVLLGAWLTMALAPPEPLRRIGFGPIHITREAKDPYALPPAGSGGPLKSLVQPDEPVDAVDAMKPLRDLVTPAPSYQAPAPPAPPADGSRGTPRVNLRLSSSQSAFGEGVVLVVDVSGDGRTVRGDVEFVADGKVVERRTLRVQGTGSQMELRLVGLEPGTHVLQARYLGSRTYFGADSPPIEHRVARR
jgi:hypothetical protein